VQPTLYKSERASANLEPRQAEIENLEQLNQSIDDPRTNLGNRD